MTTITVARRYAFTAEHWVEGLGERWAQPHSHAYKVEVVVESTAIEPAPTDELDATWEMIRPEEGTPLNHSVGGPTTVEDLAARWLLEFTTRHSEVLEVTVWEDDERWGKARF